MLPSVMGDRSRMESGGVMDRPERTEQGRYLGPKRRPVSAKGHCSLASALLGGPAQAAFMGGRLP